MLARVITTLLVMSLFLSGCGYQDQIAELESELVHQEEELQSTQDALKETQSTLKEQEDELSQLREDLAMLQDEAARPQVAHGVLQAELVPNPVLPDDKGMWMYRAYVSAGSVRVRLTLVVIRMYWEGHIVASKSYGEEDMPVLFSQKLDEGYLSAYGGTFFNGGFPRQALDQLGVLFVGIDDNGNTIEADEVKVDLVQ